MIRLLQMGAELDTQGSEADDIVKTLKYSSATEELVKITYPNGSVADYTYDENGNVLTKIVSKNGSPTLTARYTYEPDYNFVIAKEISSSADARVYEIENIFNPEGTLNAQKVIVDAATELTTTFTYNDNGDTETVTDANGSVVQKEYNAYGFLTRTFDPANPAHQTQYTYDALGNMESVTDANGSTTALEYDVLNRITKITNALGEE
ncbi:MAG: RHS repeat protein, partial [Gammaproteobacteria bacterium]|nr:RHS repeat protein [Gammaproteobacteria bacterium]